MRWILLILAFTAVAQDRVPRVGVGLAQRKLTLQEAAEFGLKNNLEIEIERANLAGTSAGVITSRGYFDPHFRWQPGFETRATPTGSILVGPSGKLSEHFHNQNFRFQQLLPWQGTSVGIDFENSRQSTSNPFSSLNPFLTSRLLFSFTQPLVRGRKTDRERTELKIRRKQVEQSEVEVELKAIDVTRRVEEAYWDLVAARQDASVKADFVEWARQQIDRTKRQINAGTLAPVELSAAEAELERRRDTWYQSVAVLTEAENRLKTLIAPSRQADVWSEELLPVEASREQTGGLEDLAAAVKQALALRGELRSNLRQQESNEIQKQQNAEQHKPSVNLVAGYANSGLAGSIRPGENPITASNILLYSRVNQLSTAAGLVPLSPGNFGALPDNLLGGYGATLSNVFQGRYQTLQAGLQVEWLPRNRAADGAVQTSVATERRLKAQRLQLEQNIEAQVRNALQQVETARQRIQAASASARAAKEKMDSEIRLFETGESTNFLVLTRQNEFADSRAREVAARADYHKALARLEQAAGVTLKAKGMTLQ